MTEIDLTKPLKSWLLFYKTLNWRRKREVQPLGPEFIPRLLNASSWEARIAESDDASIPELAEKRETHS